MFKKILVPTDGSEMALHAAQYARALAEKFDSEVMLVHVVQNYYSLPAFSMPDTVSIPLSVLQDLEANGKFILAKTQEVFAGFTGRVSTRLEFGPPGKELIDIAVEGGYSVIVMGRRGLSGVTEMFLGSVSNHIVHYAPCPTLIVKGPANLK
ncbi:MAG: universal stress protein [Negativicutes bacterium]|nr:universal stress protein [Negativicutes bacterium]